MVSEADRYARILNVFSPLISSRSAISAKTCAIGRLSTREAVALDRVVEELRAAAGERRRDRGVFLWWAVTEQTSAAASAADFCGGRAPRHCASHQLFHYRSFGTGRQPLSAVPLFGNLRIETAPNAPRQSDSPRHSHSTRSP